VISTILRPHLDQSARDFLDDVILSVSEIGSVTDDFDDQAVSNTVATPA